ncbi:MAG: hypothetical protein FJ265_12210 [Planctomycetes bacterium]|nr:hypothetical protein [Planctomycetota bacterium]
MVTSVGRTAAGTCAAIRAGISRARPTRELAALDPETQDLVPSVAHTVSTLTEGFRGIGRWVRLGRLCLESLVTSRSDWRQTGLSVVTRPISGEFLLLEDEDVPLAAVTQSLVGPLCKDLGLAAVPSHGRLVCEGVAGLATALREARTALEQRRLERFLVVAVDSWIDPTLLGMAAESGRLRDADNPVGFQPGEAGVALLLEPSAGNSGGVVVEDARTFAAAEHAIADPEAAGRELAATVQAVLATVPQDSVRDLVLDLNGEEWRARLWGAAAQRLGNRLAGMRVHLPAASMGDVGAASGAVGVCLAVQAFERGWARGQRALVMCTSESKLQGCILIGGGAA